MSKFIQYTPNSLALGGFGHSFVDYMSCLLISKIFKIPFINHKKLQINTSVRHKLAIIGVDKQNASYWHTFLNLDALPQTKQPPNAQKIIIRHGKHFKTIPFKKLSEIIDKNTIQMSSLYYHIILVLFLSIFIALNWKI